MNFNLTYLDNLDMFYHLCKNKNYVPLFHGTRKYAVECDPTLIEMMRKHCVIILEKARDYYNSLDSQTYDKYWEYRKVSKLQYFASHLVLTFGGLSNYQYGDFYMTRRFDETYLLRFTTYGCGEIGRFAYDNILGLKHFNIDLGINESMEFVLKHYPDFINSEQVVLILNDYKLDELKGESGGKVYEIEDGVNFRLCNYQNKEFFVIKESLFNEAMELFDEENREVLECKLTSQEIKIGLGWLHDVFYSAKLIEYKRKIPLEEYQYNYIYNEEEYINACKTISDIFVYEKIDYDDLEVIDKAIFLFNKKPFSNLQSDDSWEYKTNYELTKYLSRYIFITKIFNIKISDEVFTKGIHTSILARALFNDQDIYKNK